MIERRNRARQEAYEEAIADGKKRVEELNDRFGNWYYVVPNVVYNKIRLGRDDFVTSADNKDQDKQAGAASPNDSLLGGPGSAVPGLPNIDLDIEPAAESASETTDATSEQAAETEAADAGS